jgi:hypothetical protein
MYICKEKNKEEVIEVLHGASKGPDIGHGGVTQYIHAKKKLARLRHGELQLPGVGNSRLFVAHAIHWKAVARKEGDYDK